MNPYSCEKTISISSPIPIPNQPKLTYKELGLTHTSFDPSKMTPPNYFMEKLSKRMDSYYSSSLLSSKSSPSQSPNTSPIISQPTSLLVE